MWKTQTTTGPKGCWVPWKIPKPLLNPSKTWWSSKTNTPRQVARCAFNSAPEAFNVTLDRFPGHIPLPRSSQSLNPLPAASQTERHSVTRKNGGARIEVHAWVSLVPFDYSFFDLSLLSLPPPHHPRPPRCPSLHRQSDIFSFHKCIKFKLTSYLNLRWTCALRHTRTFKKNTSEGLKRCNNPFAIVNRCEIKVSLSLFLLQARCE